MDARHTLKGANAVSLSQCADDSDLLADVENVRHNSLTDITVLQQYCVCQGFLCYIFEIMKRYWVLVVWVLIAIGAIVVVTGEEQYARNKYEAKRQEDCVALAISLEEKHSCAKEAQSRHEYVPWGHKLLAWPDGITTWAIIFTGFVIGWQSYETRKSAEAARNSIRIQEAGMRQWIDIEPRKNVSHETLLGALPFNIRIQFEAVNNTPYLLTVIRVVTEVSYLAGKAVIFTVPASVPLPPSGDSKRRGYTFYAEVDVDKETYFDRGVILTINGEITFKDCMDKEQTQWFMGLYRCEADGKFFLMEPLGIVPQKTEKQYDAHPN